MTQIDEASWVEAVERMRRVVRRRGVREADVDDVVQSSLEKALRKLDGLDEPARFAAWTGRIAENTALDALRREARAAATTTHEIDGLDMPHDAHADGGEPILDFAECVLPMLARLPARDAELLRAKDLQGVSFTALADAHGMRVPGVKSRVRRARQALAHAIIATCGGLRAAGSPQPFAAQDCRRCCTDPDRPDPDRPDADRPDADRPVQWPSTTIRS